MCDGASIASLTIDPLTECTVTFTSFPIDIDSLIFLDSTNISNSFFMNNKPCLVLALPRLASPRRAQPRRALPSHAVKLHKKTAWHSHTPNGPPIKVDLM
jgi:hypothetical protein